MRKQGDLRIDEFDGHNCMERTMNFGAKGAVVGAFYGAVASALLPPEPAPTPLILQSLNMMKNSAILVGAVASLFAGTTCTLAAVRGKDDYKNWAAGGALSGTLIGLRRRNYAVGTGASVALGVAAGVAKYTGVYKQPFRTDRIWL